LSITVKAAKDGVVAFATPDAMDTDVVIDLRTQYGPALIKACEKLLSIKKGGERSKASALALLSTTCLAPGGVGGQVEIESVFEHIKTFLTMTAQEGQGFHHRETASKSLKLDALKLIRIMLASESHEPIYLRKALLRSLLADVCASVQEKWYKVISEALRVLAEIPRIMVAGYTKDDKAATKKKEMDLVASSLYDAVEPMLAAHDVDQEIKECALKACGALLSGLHTSLSTEQQ
jgi:cullin-associated NEDD8-dissociated protein 1